MTFFLLQFLRNFFYAEGEGPIPLESLTNQKYRDIVSIRLYYDWSTYVIVLLLCVLGLIASPLSGICLWKSASA
jgi:hypothetical protein